MLSTRILNPRATFYIQALQCLLRERRGSLWASVILSATFFPLRPEARAGKMGLCDSSCTLCSELLFLSLQVGGIKPGCFKIGNTGGMLDNILASKLYRPGSVAYVSRSGGMSNELNNIISRTTDGVYEGVAIGGDR